MAFEKKGVASRKVVECKTSTIRAEEVVVLYQLREMPSIVLRASSGFPFEGRVECDITVLSGVGSAKATTIPPLPEGYLEVNNTGGGRYFGRAPIWHSRISSAPLPVLRPPFVLAPGFPDAVEKDAGLVRSECL